MASHSGRLDTNTKTVLGDPIHWDTLKLPFRGCAKNDPTQLLRCRKHKKIEAECVLSLPRHASVVDCGSHFGDTVLTLAVHARENYREDIRFIAFEPSRRKCKFIRAMVRANGLDQVVRIVNRCVGETCQIVTKIDETGFDRYDGRVAYAANVLDGGGGEADVSSTTDSRLYFDGLDATFGDDSGSESDSSDDEDENAISMVSLDSMKQYVLPLGLLHLDVEGWEARVLSGASEILQNTNDSCYIVCEVWDERDLKRRHKACDRGNPGDEVVAAMKPHSQFKRLGDIVDQERNLLFQCQP